MKQYKNIDPLLWLCILCCTVSGCRYELDMNEHSLVVFHSGEATYVIGTIVEQQNIEDVTLVLAYEKGQGKQVDICLMESFGITAVPLTVTLNEGDGTISLPLRGLAKEAGRVPVKVRISYEQFHAFVTVDVGVRPQELAGVRITNIRMEGQLHKGIEAKDCKIVISYENGWGRTLRTYLSSEPAVGIALPDTVYKLEPDGLNYSLEIPLPGKPQQAGKAFFMLYLEIEGSEKITETIFERDIRQPITYEPASISHELIVTDRNILLSHPELLERKVFTYQTVFIDMDSDGYVSGNQEIWLDRNIGATSSDPASPDSYGFYYQGGRDAPGMVPKTHSPRPGVAGNYYQGEKYCLNNALWFNGTEQSVKVGINQGDGIAGKLPIDSVKVLPGEAGPSDLCPPSYKLPTAQDWKMLLEYLGTNAAPYPASELKLPLAGGVRSDVDGFPKEVGVSGYYWGCPVGNGNITVFQVAKSVQVVTNSRGFACTIRCVKK